MQRLVDSGPSNARTWLDPAALEQRRLANDGTVRRARDDARTCRAAVRSAASAACVCGQLLNGGLQRVERGHELGVALGPLRDKRVQTVLHAAHAIQNGLALQGAQRQQGRGWQTRSSGTSTSRLRMVRRAVFARNAMH